MIAPAVPPTAAPIMAPSAVLPEALRILVPVYQLNDETKIGVEFPINIT